MNEIIALKEDFYRAHYGISFSPEIRASQDVAEFSAELRDDLAELGDKAGDYAPRYAQHVKIWASKMASCMSPMIAGPSKFPYDKNRRAFDRERAAWEDFRAWRERYIKRAFREPTKSPEQEIDDALFKLERARNNHTLMVEANKILRRKILDSEKIRALVEELELSPEAANKLVQPDFMGRIGFPAYALTNSNARMKDLQAKVVTMRLRIEARDSFATIFFPGGSINVEDDRVVIRHDTKPSDDIRAALKAHGFHWAPTGNFWCRKHTANALCDAKTICAVN